MSRKRTVFALLMLFAMSAVFATSKVSVKGTEVSPVDDLNSSMLKFGCLCMDLSQPPCPEDMTGDGQVNVTDLLKLLAQWDCACVGGAIVGCGPGADTSCPSGFGEGIGDFDGSDKVDEPDLEKLLAAWGPCGGGEG